ncbi:VOC family protein [Timonella sp. A28]|uniref:VOC family protein n=1 Tax=Timonella sp. A28 TaxID=3442640 RepID=UPI003EC148A7
MWKIVAASKKNGSHPVEGSFAPLEIGFYAGGGVAQPSSGKSFYENLGMIPDHDYGNKFVDFTVQSGSLRLGLLPVQGLARDAGVLADGSGFSGVVLLHNAASKEDLDAFMSTARENGGKIVHEAQITTANEYCGFFQDLDGFFWKVVTAI